MRERIRAPLAVFFGVALVVSAAFTGVGPGGGVVQTAEADPWLQGCYVGPVLVLEGPTNVCDGPSVNQTELDAEETEKELYTSAATQAQNNENYLTSMGNYLEDTRSIALMEGKYAYIQALNNGSSEAAAQVAATEAVSEYYAVKQQNLIAAWNTSLALHNTSWHTAQTTTGVNSSFVRGAFTHTYSTASVTLVGFGAETLTLVNSSTASAMNVTLNLYTGTFSREYSVGLVTGNVSETDSSDNTVTATGLAVTPPNDNFEDEAVPVTFSEFATTWSEIEAQNDAVQSELEVFVNNTYEQYQAGEINTSALIDPYLGAREYSPEAQFNAWALRSFSAMGIEPPENLSNIGEMSVYDATTGITYEGILLSASTPSGGYEVGTTYNASAIQGAQLVITGNRSHRLTGEFHLKSATTADGRTYEAGDNITYTNITYETANTTEYQALMDQVQNLTAQINAYQQAQRNAGGGGGGWFNFGGLGLGVLGGLGLGGTVIIAGAAAYVVLARP